MTADALNNSGASPDVLNQLREAQSELRNSLQGAAAAEHPRISIWREAYRKFGAKPKKYPSSIENLVRRVLKGEDIRPISKVVDIYNTVSLRHLLPVGGEDLAQIVGDIHLTIAGNDEPSVKLLGEVDPRAPKAGEVIYKDDIGAICRRWNWKEADRTKITEATTRAVLVIESLPPVSLQELENAMTDLTSRLEQYCDARLASEVLTETHAEMDLE
jgi:DNA/RNA-binding domain of Phe-tRNA-synthetase-like protein